MLLRVIHHRGHSHLFFLLTFRIQVSISYIYFITQNTICVLSVQFDRIQVCFSIRARYLKLRLSFQFLPERFSLDFGTLPLLFLIWWKSDSWNIWECQCIESWSVKGCLKWVRKRRVNHTSSSCHTGTPYSMAFLLFRCSHNIISVICLCV